MESRVCAVTVCEFGRYGGRHLPRVQGCSVTLRPSRPDLVQTDATAAEICPRTGRGWAPGRAAARRPAALRGAVMDWKLELVAVPVTDVDRAKAFYVDQVGFVLDHDHRVSDEIRFVQLTPPGSACSIALGRGLVQTPPGSAQGLQLVVPDIEAARTELEGRGVHVGEVERQPWGAFLYFTDPDGNGWAVQELPPRGCPGTGRRRRALDCPRPTRGEGRGEEDRVPVLRTLAAHPRVAGAHRAGRAGAERRAGGGRRGARRGRRLRAGAPLRPAARLALSAARRDGRPHQPDRGRHRRRRHALRESAVHGGGGRGDR